MIYVNLLLVFIILIFIHEIGHYLSARFFKTIVTDFSIGFGKPIYTYTDKNKTNWKFSMIPLGGYVKIKGLESIFQNNSEKINEENSFQSLNLFKQIIILLAGSIFNILSAWICLFFILFFFGIATFSTEVGKIYPNSAAEINDIRKGDIIINVNDNNVYEFSDIGKEIKNTKSIKLNLIRKNELIVKEFQLKYDKNFNKYILGISSNNNPTIQKYFFTKSLFHSLYFIPNYYKATYNFLIQSLNDNTISNQLAGPIGMVKMADQLMLDNIRGVLIIFIMISLFVGIFNLLPIPLLDGGHIVYFILRKIFSGALPHFITRVYLMIGITIISFLFIFVTLNDIFYK